MPYRREEGTDWVRDPLAAAAPTDYLVHKDTPSRILDFYERSPDDASRKTPDLWDQIEHKETNDRGRIILMRRQTDACVEVTYKVVDGVKTDFEVRPLSREEAYRLALDQDDLLIKLEGQPIINERHPRP